MLTQAELKARLQYEAESGLFHYSRPTKGRTLGAVAGTVRDDGYVTIIIAGRPYAAARLAWLYVHGSWPPDEIDHIDRDPSNNRITNLRSATRSQNNCNHKVRSDSKTGIKGVHLHKKSGLLQVVVRYNGKRHSVGYYKNKEEAASAYQEAAAKIHGEYACQM